MPQNIKTKSQMQRAETSYRRAANNFGSKRKKPRPLDLRGQSLHDGIKEKRDVPYHVYLISRHWRIARAKAIALAGSRCSVCGDKRHLNVHHITYDNLWHEYANDVAVLCNTCHNMLHGQYIHPA
jgi:hypothetical protein